MDYGRFGFLRVAAASPPLRLADPGANAAVAIEWARSAAGRGVSLLLFPELSLTGYTCEDLFQTRSLLDGARAALLRVARETSDLDLAIVVGAPLAGPDGRLYNAAVVMGGGRIHGAVPKTHLPTYGEYYERRWFASGAGVDLDLGGFRLCARQLFRRGPAVFAVEICEDLWAPVPESGAHALAGAALILNPSASNDGVAKAEYRRELVRQQSGRLHAAYVYASSGPTESSKDVVYGGHSIIAENGTLLVESERFDLEGGMILEDVDLERLGHERIRNTTFMSSPSAAAAYARHDLGDGPPLPELGREVPRTPFVPADPARVSERAREILAIQSTGLARRLQSGPFETAVIGVSGGLDSTLALLVSVQALRRLERPLSAVQAVSMPGPGTSARTREAAAALSRRLGVGFREIPIGPAVEQHFRDLGHDPSVHDVVFENTQARERTQILFDLANKLRGIVIGTGDMSELALGWCTYNGDHMANYAVNVSVPKTLVQHLVRWAAEHEADAPTRELLQGILDTPISPELLPPDEGGRIAQATEAVVGPYVLHDFFLYQSLRWGASPRKILALARRAFRDEFKEEELRRWLKVFLERFHRQQFKRTCLPPGPKVGSVSLSPRGDLRMPDEVDPAALLDELRS
jgi:NAD+ synthase (glutamine-hydrolysing)